MAIYHLTAKTGSRKNGQSAAAKSDYICREGKYIRQPDACLHVQSGHMPDWAERPTDYWGGADLYERANGRLFKEVEFALPVELTLDQQRELVDEFASHLTQAERLPYTLAIHAGGGENPHCHLMISERKNDGIERPADQWFKRYNAKQPERGGAQKSESLKPKAWLEQTREAWADHANRALEQAGKFDRIDHRSLEAQGVDRLPQIHIGPQTPAMAARGIPTDRFWRAAETSAANERIQALAAERARVEVDIYREESWVELPVPDYDPTGDYASHLAASEAEAERQTQAFAAMEVEAQEWLQERERQERAAAEAEAWLRQQRHTDAAHVEAAWERRLQGLETRASEPLAPPPGRESLDRARRALTEAEKASEASRADLRGFRERHPVLGRVYTPKRLTEAVGRSEEREREAREAVETAQERYAQRVDAAKASERWREAARAELEQHREQTPHIQHHIEQRRQEAVTRAQERERQQGRSSGPTISR